MATTTQSPFTATPSYPATFIQPMGEKLADLLASEINRPTDIAGLMPQVAGQNALQQAALQQQATQGGLGALQFDAQGQLTGVGQGTGIAGYQPYLNQAQSYSGPQGYQQFMTPYQQQVLEPTLQQYDIQAQKGLYPLAAQAVNRGAFGGAREGIQKAEYQSQSDLNRALLQANLLNQGYGQANQFANQAFGQQMNLAQIQPQLAYQSAQQLGQAGTGQQAYQQGILNAIQQGNMLQNQYPVQRLSGLASLFGNIANATPGEPGTPLLTNPSLTAAQAFASIFGPMTQYANASGGATGSGGGSGVGGILNAIPGIYNAGKSVWDTVSSWF